MKNNDLNKTDLLEQAFTRLAIMLADKYCNEDNDITYHFNYDNVRYDVIIKTQEI